MAAGDVQLPFSGLPFFQDVVTAAPPSAGNDLVLPNDPRYVSLLVALTFQVVASAAVASRIPVVAFEDAGGNPRIRMVASNAMAAGQTRRYNFALLNSQTTSNATQDFEGQLDPYLQYGGDQIAIRTFSMDAGDTYQAVRFTFWRFPESLEGWGQGGG